MHLIVPMVAGWVGFGYAFGRWSAITVAALLATLTAVSLQALIPLDPIADQRGGPLLLVGYVPLLAVAVAVGVLIRRRGHKRSLSWPKPRPRRE